MERTVTLSGKPMPVVGPELKVGDSAPDFRLIDSSMNEVSLESTGKKTRLFSVVPSLDTPVCDAQTKRFNDEVAKHPEMDVYTVSMDLPFGQKRWCSNFGVDRVKMLSDHRDGSFGEQYGTLIKDLRIESRAIFVVGSDNKIKYVEYVGEVGDPPNFDAALAAAQD